MKPFAILALAMFVSSSSVALADCCQHCGCNANCCKVCRCVPDVKKVPKTTYSCECEDFCVPGPSEHCVVCDECGNKQHIYTPTCATMHTRKKLVKHETVKEVKTYKWVVESLCPACCAKVNGEADAEAAPVAQADAINEAQQVSYQQPSAEPQNASPPSGNSTLKSQLRRMLQPVLGRESSAP